MKRYTLLFVGIFLVLGMVAVAIYFPTSLPTNSDFSAIYATNLAFVNKIDIYDLQAMQEFVQARVETSNQDFIMVRFLYPPWYVLSTFYLGFLPVSSAATLWFEINLIMLFFSIGLLTSNWNERLRLFMFPLGLMFLPVIGALIVGQYDFPVLLGISLLLHGFKKDNAPEIVSGMILVTFKPHLGALVFLCSLIWLVMKRNDFHKRVLRYIILTFFIVTCLCFLVNINWILGYLNILLTNQNEVNVNACSGECVSLPLILSRWLFDGTLLTALIIGMTILILFVVFCYLNRFSFLSSVSFFIISSILITLLVSPYLFNYDFILLLIPFVFLIENRTNKFTSIVVILCFLIPYFAIGMYGRDGNISLILITLLITIIFYYQIRALTTPSLTHTMQPTK